MIAEAASLLQRGKWDQALSAYEHAFRSSLSGNEWGRYTLECVRRIGYAYFSAGDTEIALEYLELAIELAILHRDCGSLARALNGIATVYQSSGRTEEADRYYAEALSAAPPTGDPLALGDIHQNRGTLACVRGDHESALLHFGASLKHYAAAEHQLGKAQALHNLGLLHIETGQHEEAALHIADAIEIFASQGDWRGHAAALLSKGNVAINRGDYRDAQNALELAFAYACRVDDPRLRAESLKFFGALNIARGEPALAARQLHNAVTVARAYRLPQVEAESLRELARALRQVQRNADALHALTAAHRIFSAIQAERGQADIAARLHRLESDFLDIVQYWIISIEEKDPYTKGHCQRVADYACRLATWAGLPQRELVWFRMGALLHDVGKTSIPAAILRKSGRLSEAEMLLVQQHPILGEKLISSVEFPWNIREMIRSHHERWDGKGYPDGLCGSSIPFTARILRFADVFDALTTSRPYRAALLPEDALQVMRADCGGFDPSLFALFEAGLPTLSDMATHAQ